MTDAIERQNAAIIGAILTRPPGTRMRDVILPVLAFKAAAPYPTPPYVEDGAYKAVERAFLLDRYACEACDVIRTTLGPEPSENDIRLRDLADTLRSETLAAANRIAMAEQTGGAIEPITTLFQAVGNLRQTLRLPEMVDTGRRPGATSRSRV